MARLVKCDRCGVMMPEVAYTAQLKCEYLPLLPKPTGTEMEVDLCVHCANSLRAFFRNEDVGRRYRFEKE